MNGNSEREHQLNVTETLAGQRKQMIWSAVEGIRRTLGISEVPAPQTEVAQLSNNAISLEEQRIKREQTVAKEAFRNIDVAVARADVDSVLEAEERGNVTSIDAYKASPQIEPQGSDNVKEAA